MSNKTKNQEKNATQGNGKGKVTPVVNSEKGATPTIDETIDSAKEVINTATNGEIPEVKEENATPTIVEPEKPKKPEILITKAEYGTPGKMVEFTTTCKLGFKLTNKMVGQDPNKGKVKSATVDITIDGIPYRGTFNENEKMLLTDFVKVETVPQEVIE